MRRHHAVPHDLESVFGTPGRRLFLRIAIFAFFIDMSPNRVWNSKLLGTT
jgi:hypothetical protein